MRFQYLIILLSLGIPSELYSQPYQVEMSVVDDNIKSNSDGDRRLEYTGYSLKNTLSIILKIPKEFI